VTPSPEGTLTRERILEAAQDVLRRFGPQKATVVDVARALGVSHGSVYRHFPSKTALREAVVRQWLEFTHEPLERTLRTTQDDPAPERLRAWLRALVATKRAKAREDPELFATYGGLAAEASAVIAEHLDDLCGQIASILAQGVERAEVTAPDAPVTARAILAATSRFHDPLHAAEWSDPGADEAFEGVLDLVVRGLGGRQRGQTT